MRNILKLFAAIAVLAIAFPGAVLAADDGHGTEIEAQDWSFAPPFGHFDRAQLQRGYKVYQFVCANCHGMKLLSYRNLGEPGGPQFSEAAVEALASQAQITDGPDDMGKMFQSASSFNRDLSDWCVSGISPQPFDFDAGATAWTLPSSRPNWGSPCPP